MEKQTKRVFIAFIIVFFILSIFVGVLSYVIIDVTTKESWVSYATPYFETNIELKEELGKIQKFECLGRKSEGEADGLPVCFEVKAEKGIFYVLLWFDIVSYDPDEYEIVKHLVTTTIPDDIV